MEGYSPKNDPLRPEAEQGSSWVKFNDSNPDSVPVASSNDENDPDRKQPAVIETTVAIVPRVQIQSPSKISSQSSTELKNSQGGIQAPSTQNNSNSNNVKKDKPPTFVNVSSLENIELRNSQTSLHEITTASSSTSGTGINGRSVNRRPGFTNGDEIVSILPMNTQLPWITPANFRPELVPEELMNESLTLTVEEYVHIMEILTSDFRFNVYIICYKRLLAIWLLLAFLILLCILFSGIGGISLFAMGITWLIINAMAVFLCMYIKIKINKGLERCMAKVNKLLLKHKLVVGLDDRGKISCHKVQLSFIYFDAAQCIKRLAQMLDASNDRQRLQQHLDVNEADIIIGTGTNSRRISQSQNGEQLFLRYIQRYCKDFLRKRLDWNPEGNPETPLHLNSALCICQYVEEYLKHKPVTQAENSCSWFPFSRTQSQS